MMIGLGAIAKGYGVDRASAVLRARGFPHHIVEGGGDTYVSGTKGSSSWMVGIQRPEGIGTIGALPVRDRAVVTSGGYQRFFEYEGKRYAHILDPRTGWALDEAKSALSVTVVAANATDADAFCTAIMVMGPQEGMEFVTQHASLEAVIIPRTGPVEISPGLRSSYVVAPGQARPPSLPPAP
jgi:thiamine biosynthesis lipoprotein